MNRRLSAEREASKNMPQDVLGNSFFFVATIIEHSFISAVMELFYFRFTKIHAQLGKEKEKLASRKKLLHAAKVEPN
jgi:hypothetical protein